MTISEGFFLLLTWRDIVALAVLLLVWTLAVSGMSYGAGGANTERRLTEQRRDALRRESGAGGVRR